MAFGTLEGERCWRNGCDGVIEAPAAENCTCFQRPPCNACVTPREVCLTCGWIAAEEGEPLNGFLVHYNEDRTVLTDCKPRPLDPRKIDWRSRSHSNASMIKEGVFPPGLSREDVEKAVAGTFGGRFVHFDPVAGAFKYIAYTD
ncbi:hypothetical protein CcrC1_gp340 [Caulobacter phage C1]|nr:hypothetical protein CcrC1_gp340 [Caulobacter phage C1]UTU08569.1 hypothetical protein CcrC2_gp341 [Caulobacter phage C2]UTU09085.1 hypothetical protein CcrJ4_gp336 [Caulobacter phage J4]UTU09644.1 hypothetical protein CcrBL47_gp358 [Caulobacter phage BL47]UTU10202.1 hypothetical protein CcrRB23_gp340 [Caulobacter phage RB23]WGN97236.1 hypothetical protein [Bertelyvirus sp.]